MGVDQIKSLESSPGPVSKHPCVTCQRRKVKCDRKDPCTRCIQSGQECTQPEAHRAPRRSRRTEDSEVLDRVRQLEKALERVRKSVIKDESVQVQKSEDAGDLQRDGKETKMLEDSVGRLIVDDDKTRYISGSSWANLADEVGGLRTLLEDDDRSVEDELAPKRTFTHYLSNRMFPSDGTPLKAPCSQTGLAFLWQIYVRNIDPMVKIFHAPTTQPIIDGVISGGRDPVSKEYYCLLAAIKFAAVTSLTDEQCWTALDASRKSLLDLFRSEVQATLDAANFLSTHDLTTLQAYIIFQFCNRRHENPRAMWVASGIAIRLAQSIGLHRDGAVMKLPVLATEVRRRLFWELRLIDLACAEDCGFLPTHIYGADTRIPLNINDADLSWGSVTPPPERDGFTDMTCALIRYEMCNRLHGLNYHDGKFSMGILQSDEQGIAGKAKLLADCRAVVESRCLQHCSPSIPFQKTALWMGQIILSKHDLLAQYPLFHSSFRSTAISSDLREQLFDSSCKLLEMSNELLTDPETSGWRWVLQTYVHWHPVAFLLNELCKAPRHPQANRAWIAIEKEIAYPHGLSFEANQALWRPLRGLHERAKLAAEAASPRSYFEFTPTTSTGLDGASTLPLPAPSQIPFQEQTSFSTLGPNSSLATSDDTIMAFDLQTPFATMIDFMPGGSSADFDFNSWWIDNDLTLSNRTSS